jgi:uncharacterized membrane protein YhdT
VSAFRTHFLEKYFAYRRRYVAHIESAAPHRARLAIASEIARLGFMILGCALCAAIFWLLTAGAVQRAGGFGVWPAVFALCAFAPTLFAGLSTGGLATAVRALRAQRADRRAGTGA